MKHELAYIESFFNNELNTQERLKFEQRCATDKAFAEEVALYVKTKYGFMQIHRNQRKAEFEKLRRKPKQHFLVQRKQATYWLSAVAAVFIFALSLWYFSKPDLQELADTYIRENFMILSSTMSTEKDDLQRAIGLFNEGEIEKASVIFDSLAQHNNTDALKYAGIAYLRLQNYNTAIERFTTLEQQTLQSNPGVFYHALALLQRKQGNDLNEAQKLVEKIKAEKLEGWQELEKRHL